MKKDKEETTNLAHKRKRIVKKLTTALAEIVDNGRTTTGQKQQNDVPVDMFKKDVSKITEASH